MAKPKKKGKKLPRDLTLEFKLLDLRAEQKKRAIDRRLAEENEQIDREGRARRARHAEERKGAAAKPVKAADTSKGEARKRAIIRKGKKVLSGLGRKK